MCELATEGKLYNRTLVGRNSNQVTALGIGNKTKRSVVAYRETEPLHIEGLGRTVPVKGRIGLGSIQLFYLEHIALIAVAKVERSGIEGSVLENRQDLVLCAKLSKVDSAAVLIQPLDIGIVPDILAADSGNTLVLEGYPLDGVLCHKIAP